MPNSFASANHIDLRGTACPINFIRCSLAIEELDSHETIQVDLDTGEPEEMVISGLKKAGHNVKIIQKETNWVRILVEVSE